MAQHLSIPISNTSLTQQGIACYVIKLNRQIFRLRSKSGVAFALGRELLAQHPLAEHSDKDIFVAEQVAQMLFSSSLPASGLSPGMTVSRRMPPRQQLTNLEAATAATNYSHLDGQAAIAGPLGTVQNKLIAFWAIPFWAIPF